MFKKITLITCAILLGLPGLVLLSLIYAVGLVAYVMPINIFLIFPLSMFYLYACFAGRPYRFLIGLAIVIAYLFMVVVTENYPGGSDTIYLARDIFGSQIDFVMLKKSMPWNLFIELYRDPRGAIVMFAPLILGFALIELGGWCFRKAHVRSPSPKARVAMKGITLFLVNAMNLTMLAAWVGLVSKGDTTWGYLVYILAILAIGTFLLALFIWFKPTWRWWIAMLPSIVILYVMPFWLTTYLNDRGEIESPWNKADDRGTIEAPRRSP